LKINTKIIISLFVSILFLHATAALLTYITISSGRYVEGNPTTAMLQFIYGVPAGLALTFLEGTAMSMVPLTIYMGTLRYAQSKMVPPCDKPLTMQFVSYCFFPLALFVLGYLMAIAGADVIHDLSMVLSGGTINLWSF
jgi:membrane protein insertase Oxa1/YidC/SpoIIIJ